MLSSVIQSEQLTECTVSDFNFHLFDGFFSKLMLLNSYKIQQTGKNLDKSEHLSLGLSQTSIAAMSSLIFLREGFFNQHIFTLIILPHIPNLQGIMGT